MTQLYHLNNVTFSYGKEFSLTNVNLEIEQSSVTAIVGPNGSGKTTLLNMLAFLNFPLLGAFKYKDQNLDKKKFEQARKSVGFIQQNPYLLRGSVNKNIELGLKIKHIDKDTRSRKVSEVLQLLDIMDLSERSARTLSGGEAQKVAVGQVLVLDPDVLILDEPFTYLDKRSIHELELLILKLKNELKKTIIFTTHNQLQAQLLSDYIYSVVKGNVFKSQLINLFNGTLDVDNKIFNTGKQFIHLPEAITEAEHIAVDPKQIVLSREKLDSSMQNSFQGKITSMVEEEGQVKVSVNSGENFQATITHKALEELGLSIGKDVWISFKSSSILIF